MLNSIINCLPLRRHYLEVPVAGLLLAIGIQVSEAKPVLTNELNKPATPQLAARIKAFSKDSANTPKGRLPEKDGIYLYGQSPKPEQIGQEYMVFEMNRGKVVGAFYLPQSEFSCFQGNLKSGKLALMVASGSGTEPYPDPVAGNSQQVAAVSDRFESGSSFETSTYSYSVALQNYYQLPIVSNNDQRILSSCKNQQ